MKENLKKKRRQAVKKVVLIKKKKKSKRERVKSRATAPLTSTIGTTGTRSLAPAGLWSQNWLPPNSALKLSGGSLIGNNKRN